MSENEIRLEDTFRKTFRVAMRRKDRGWEYNQKNKRLIPKNASKFESNGKEMSSNESPHQIIL